MSRPAGGEGQGVGQPRGCSGKGSVEEPLCDGWDEMGGGSLKNPPAWALGGASSLLKD